MLRRRRPEPRRERDPLRRARGDVHARGRARPGRRGRRCAARTTAVGVDGGGAAAAVRALLPRRPRARLARHGARARDREARRHAGRRDGRGARWARRGARDPLRLPAPLAPPVRHVLHRFFTGADGSARSCTRGRHWHRDRPCAGHAGSMHDRGTTRVRLAGNSTSRRSASSRRPGAGLPRRVERGVRRRGPLRLLQRQRSRSKDVTLDIHKNIVTAFIGPSGCGKSHVHPLLQPHERPHPRREGRRRGSSTTAATCTPPNVDPVEVRRRIGHGLPEAEPVPEVDLRQHRLRPARAGDEAGPRRARRAGAAVGGALGRGQGPPQGQRARPLGRPAAAALHRARDRGRARRDPHGRARLGARPDLDGADRGPRSTSSSASTRS